MADFKDPGRARAKRGGLLGGQARQKETREDQGKWTTGVGTWDECPACDRLKRSTSYICGPCENAGGVSKRLPLAEYIETLAADRPQYTRKKQAMCENCEMLEICATRLQVDPAAWVLCEIPDYADLMSASSEALEEYERWFQNLKSDRRPRKRKSSKLSKNGKDSRSSGEPAGRRSGPVRRGRSSRKS